MYLAVGETVEEIGVDGSETDVAILSTATESGYVFQKPDDFGRRKVGVNDEACFFLDHFLDPPFPEAAAKVGGAAALPYNGVVDGFTRAPVPQDGGFSLVGNPDAREVRRADARVSDRVSDHGARGTPDFLRIVRNPPGLRINLAEFRVGAAGDSTCPVDNEHGRARGALIDGKNHKNASASLGMGSGGVVDAAQFRYSAPSSPITCSGEPPFSHFLSWILPPSNTA